MSAYELAQLNIAQPVAALDSPTLVDFVENLARINALADRSPGFVWRLQTEDGDATAIRYFGDDTIVNLSVWKDVEALRHYVYKTAHAEVLSRRKEWFRRMGEAYTVLWWVPKGDVPTMAEADAKLQFLRTHGPSPAAFTFKKAYPAPTTTAALFR